jgi:hypothetical protein
MVDEDGIERLRHDGHVHWWARRGTAWPGHTTFVALRGGEVVVGDRYASEAVERTYACELAALLDGCFQELVAQQLGPRVLEELLAAVRRELGVAAGTGSPFTKNAREAATAKPPAPVPASEAAKSPATGGASEAAKPPPSATATSPPTATTEPPAASRAAAGASAPAPSRAPSKVVSAPSTVPRATSIPSEQPSAQAFEPAAAAATAADRVDVAVVACRSVSLPLAVALRGITRKPVHELLGRLRSLPCRVAAGVPREQAEGLAARLAELGAEVRLLPADA